MTLHSGGTFLCGITKLEIVSQEWRQENTLRETALFLWCIIMLNEFSVRIPWGGNGGRVVRQPSRPRPAEPGPPPRRSGLSTAQTTLCLCSAWTLPRTPSPSRRCPRDPPPGRPSSRRSAQAQTSPCIFPAPWMAPSLSLAVNLRHLSLTLPPLCPLPHASSPPALPPETPAFALRLPRL